jgi:hypothetical protein
MSEDEKSGMICSGACSLGISDPAENSVSRCLKKKILQGNHGNVKVQVGFGLQIVSCKGFVCRSYAWMVLHNRIIINPRAQFGCSMGEYPLVLPGYKETNKL